MWELYLFDGTTISSSGAPAIPGNLVLQLQAVGDLDHDRNTDILLRNVNNGRWFVYTLDGTTVESSGNVGMTSSLVWNVVFTEPF